MSITAALTAHASRTPDKVALSFDDDRIRWRHLSATVDRLAAHIADLLPPGGRVALGLPDGPSLALLFLATVRAGAEAQLFDPSWPAETAAAARDDLAPDLLITRGAVTDPLATIRLPDEPSSPDDLADLLGAVPTFAAPREPDIETSFYVGFTSGSTGRPKGYRRNHRSWLESFRADADEFGFDSCDVFAAPGTLLHSQALYAMNRGLNAGATVLLTRGFRPDRFLRRLSAESATVLYAVPSQIKLLLDAAERSGAPPLTSMRWVLSAGAKWPDGERERLAQIMPEARFCEFYGASELSYVTLAKEPEKVPPGSVGRPFSGVNVTIRDPAGRRLAAGRSGLVFVDSPMRFTAYAGEGRESPPLSFGDALCIGDTGHLDGEGFLYLDGRADRMIVSAGRNIQPEEIEMVLERHAAVESAVVLGQEDGTRGQRLIALVQPVIDGPIDSASLIAFARTHLPLYKVPRRYLPVTDWPRTPSGKIDHARLPQLLAAAGERVS